MAGRRGLYRVFLMNRCNQDLNKRWNGSVFDEICRLVENMFKRVVAHPACPFTDAQCFAAGAGTSPAPGELLLYFLPSKISSIIKSNGGGSASLEAGGATWDGGNGMISEIYVDDGHLQALIQQSRIPRIDAQQTRCREWDNGPE